MGEEKKKKNFPRSTDPRKPTTAFVEVTTSSQEEKVVPTRIKDSQGDQIFSNYMYFKLRNSQKNIANYMHIVIVSPTRMYMGDSMV